MDNMDNKVSISTYTDVEEKLKSYRKRVYDKASEVYLKYSLEEVDKKISLLSIERDEILKQIELIKSTKIFV